ncbi:hypothetical protein J4E90_002820 [Alternaria incomplexa]|uniref:uncharacterized protein n=1 Tax=Alternaria incomplexa TaxID=1187928 RepID=UPI00221EF8DD|nr:uncharacterized protein J4E90_002820 [Alternaria incomplexa]KAI4918436.1 hypothetical protein J4E90_002820 [Alternaria incomplexa]
MPPLWIHMAVDAARLFHAETRRFELAQMERCEEIRREVVTLDGKAKYWGDRAAFFQTRGHLPGDEELAEAALKVQTLFNHKAEDRDWDLEDEIKLLRRLTSLRKGFQRALHMAPTRSEYVDYGDNSNLGERFRLRNRARAVMRFA